MARIAFVGLGNMGRGMATRLLEAGYPLHVYNRTSSHVASLVQLGARGYDSPKEACHGVDAVFCMVADDEASRDVWLGPQGILAADLLPDAFAIECSTLSHEWVSDLFGRCKARGLRYIDAPVTGLPEAAARNARGVSLGLANTPPVRRRCRGGRPVHKR